MCDSIYQILYFVVRGFKLIEKFEKCCNLGAKNCFFKWFAAQKSPFLLKVKPFSIMNVSRVI